MTAQHTETLIIGAGQVGHDDRPSGVLNAGMVPVKRNRFVKLSGGDKSVNRELEAKVRGLAGLKAYITKHRQPLAGVRDRRIPPALADRDVLPDVQG